MRDIFKAFYRVPEQELKAAWDDATFVLDTNVLLNLYRFPINSRRELLEIFDTLGGRLWVPFHVALEYQRGRLNVISEQQRRFAEVQTVMQAGLDSMRQKLNPELSRRHSVIDVHPVLAKLTDVIKAFNGELDALKENSDFDLEKDAVRDRLDVILAGRTGKPISKEKLVQIQKEGELRFKSEMPPGFLDADKDKKGAASFMYQGLQYEKKFGDLIIWKQIIEHAQEQKLKKIIFLTDDAKDDWWLSVNSSGPKKLGRVRIFV